MSFPLDPRSIAVIGASADEGSVGYDILHNLLSQGYAGEVYPVNPKHDVLQGKPAFRSVKDIPNAVELAVIIVPAKIVPTVLRECGEKGVHAVVVISAGFGETHTEQGKLLEEQLVQIAHEYDIALIGPNCLGIIRPSAGMNASFAKEAPPNGGIALVSQSGATAVGIMDAAQERGLGFSTVLSIGNKAVMTETDFLSLCEQDEHTTVIGLYLEDIRSGQEFLRAAAAVTAKKPIVLLKSGVSEQGRRAASSHTGALAGDDAAIDAACKQAGIRRAHNFDEFLDLLLTLSTQPPLLSRRIAVITNAGGPGILATDAASAKKLELASLDAKNAKALAALLPPAASVGNPIDVLGDAAADRFQAALDACTKDKHIDGIVVLVTPQVMTPCEDIAQAILRTQKRASMMPIVASFIGGASVRSATVILAAAGIPALPSPERAVHALAALLPTDEQPRVWQQATRNTQRPAAATALLKKSDGLLPPDVTRELFALYDLALPQQAVAHSSAEAAAIAKKIGRTVVAKVNSPDILHKTDVGGIQTNLRTPEDASAAYNDIEKNIRQNAPSAQWDGVLIQEFLPLGREFIVGGLRDPSFGPLVMVGLGGIYTELFRDTAFRIAPVTEEESFEALQQLTSWKLLLGMRGQSQANIAELARVVQRVSEMLAELEQIRELDINPVLVGEEAVAIADAKVIVSHL
jgi:acetyltransferase